MDAKDSVSILQSKQEKTDRLFKRLVLQQLFPGRFLIEDPRPYDEATDEEVESAKSILRKLMPLDTMVTDMWNWDIHFEDSTFEDTYFDVALGPEDFASEQAKSLAEDILQWIDEYDMDYAQDQWGDDGFKKWILKQCEDFVRKWRDNIVDKFA